MRATFGQVDLQLAHFRRGGEKVRVELDFRFGLLLFAFQDQRFEGSGGRGPLRVRGRLDEHLVDVGGRRIEFERVLGDDVVIVQVPGSED